MAGEREPTGDAERFEALLGGAPEASALGRLLASAAAPGRPQELAGLPDALTAFRAAQPTVVPMSGARRLRAVAGRNPRRAVTVVALVAGLSGVTSAAATGSLPRPVQQAAHDALPILSIPAPTRSHPSRRNSPLGTPGPGATVSPAAIGRPSARPSGSPHAQPSAAVRPDDHVPGQGGTAFPSPGSTEPVGDAHGQHPGRGGSGDGRSTVGPSAAPGQGEPEPGRSGGGQGLPGRSTGDSGRAGGQSSEGPHSGGHGGDPGRGGQPAASSQPSSAESAGPAPVSVTVGGSAQPSSEPSSEPQPGESAGAGDGSRSGRH